MTPPAAEQQQQRQARIAPLTLLGPLRAAGEPGVVALDGAGRVHTLSAARSGLCSGSLPQPRGPQGRVLLAWGTHRCQVFTPTGFLYRGKTSSLRESLRVYLS